jgi:hypothetical protein
MRNSDTQRYFRNEVLVSYLMHLRYCFLLVSSAREPAKYFAGPPPCPARVFSKNIGKKSDKIDLYTTLTSVIKGSFKHCISLPEESNSNMQYTSNTTYIRKSPI